MWRLASKDASRKDESQADQRNIPSIPADRNRPTKAARSREDSILMI